MRAKLILLSIVILFSLGFVSATLLSTSQLEDKSPIYVKPLGDTRCNINTCWGKYNYTTEVIVNNCTWTQNVSGKYNLIVGNPRVLCYGNITVNKSFIFAYQFKNYKMMKPKNSNLYVRTALNSTERTEQINKLIFYQLKSYGVNRTTISKYNVTANNTKLQIIPTAIGVGAI